MISDLLPVPQFPPLLCSLHFAGLASCPGTINTNFKSRQTARFVEQGEDEGVPAATPPHEQERLGHSRLQGAKSVLAASLSLPPHAQAVPHGPHASLLLINSSELDPRTEPNHPRAMGSPPPAEGRSWGPSRLHHPKHSNDNHIYMQQALIHI